MHPLKGRLQKALKSGWRHFCITALGLLLLGGCSDSYFCGSYRQPCTTRLAYLHPIGLAMALNHIVTSTNMKCMTPQHALGGDAQLLAANLYAKSIFGEDALVNVSVEKQDDGKIVGYIRIRSKTQGIALSLGDRITAVQRG